MSGARTSMKRVASRLFVLVAGVVAIASCALGASDEVVTVAPAPDAGVDGATFNCITNDDCPKATHVCHFASCNVGVCDERPMARGTIVKKNEPADCHALVCDGFGDTETIVDRSNAPPPPAVCMATTCDAMGNLATGPAAAGSACTTPLGGLKCDGAGNCVDCLDGSDCPVGQECNVLKFCEPPLCMDGFKDSRETDVDCGGVCPPCGAGRMCKHDTDCISNRCDPTTLRCISATCSNGTKDGNETDVDCGGGACPGCGVGMACRIFSDCASNVCDSTLHCIPYVNPCTDGQLDGSETDVDCGGGICAGCALGKHCWLDFDCASGACDGIAAMCVTDQCTDNRIDGFETDVDCGGTGPCARCVLGKKCIVSTDCDVGLTCNPGFPHLCN